MNTMMTNKKKYETLKQVLFISAASMLVMAILQYAFPVAFASGTASQALTGVIDLLVTGIMVICGVVGVIITLIGIIKLIMAHANDDGPAQQKAATMIGTGIVLILFGTVVIGGFKTKIASWLTDIVNEATGPTA